MAQQKKSTGVATRGAAPWWLDRGEEDCPHCDQTYSFTAEIRCIECDARVCPMCITRIGGHAFCPDCGASKDTR
jgi:hypothetical protein